MKIYVDSHDRPTPSVEWEEKPVTEEEVEYNLIVMICDCGKRSGHFVLVQSDAIIECPACGASK